MGIEMKTGKGLLIILICYVAVCFIRTVNAGAAKPKANKKSGAKIETREFTSQFDCLNGTHKGDTYIYCGTPLMSWFEAFQQCCEMGGNLPVADNLEYIEFMEELVFTLNYAVGWPWTAGTNFLTGPGSDYVWYTRNNKTLNIEKSLWAEQPLSNKKSCAKSSRKNTPRGLIDTYCHEGQGMACKLN